LLNSLAYPVRRVAHAGLVDRFVAVSDFLARAYAAKGIESVVIPNFVDLPAGAPSAFQTRNGALFAGRLSRSKGVRETIELARRLPDMPITIAGDGPLRPIVEAQAARLPNLSYLGPVGGGELEERMRSVRLVVMPSQWSEPAGLVALEAMAVGTPVVAYDRGGLTDYVCDAGGGRVISSDIELLARACSQLHADEELWNRLSSAGVAGTRRTHSADTYVRRLEGVYADARSDFEIRSRRRVDPLTPVSAA
jgi:glycosyltransferase involved in cell wall biosynthesis